MTSASTPAVLYTRAPAEAVTTWARRGAVAVQIATVQGWSIVHPVAGRAAAPYDDPVRGLLARPVPSRMRPAFFLGELDGRGVVALQSGGLRRRTRYAAWSPATGRTPLPGLTPLTAAQLAQAAGVAAVDLTVALEPPGRPGQARVLDWLLAVRDALNLPVTTLTAAKGENLEVVEPTPASVRRFNALAAEDRPDQHRPEEPSENA